MVVEARDFIRVRDVVQTARIAAPSSCEATLGLRSSSTRFSFSAGVNYYDSKGHSVISVLLALPAQPSVHSPQVAGRD